MQPAPLPDTSILPLHHVSTILWRKRQLLEMLLFKLDEEQLLLAAGRGRWLPHAAREVESVLAEIKSAELARSLEVESAAADGLGSGPSLGALVAAAPAPWDTILADHREAFLTMTQEISSVASTNRELLNRSQRAVRDALTFVHGADLDNYTPGGARAERGASAVLVNEVL